MEQAAMIAHLEAAEAELRESPRPIKLNTDYAVIVKYGKVHVLCQTVYEDSIRKLFAKHSVPVDSLHSYK